MFLKDRIGGYSWFRVWMPYAFVKLSKEPGHTFLPLNRLYHPLGISIKEWTEWDDFAHQAVRFVRNPHSFKNVWINENLYLYDDGLGIQAYFKRLEKLMSYQMRNPL